MVKTQKTRRRSFGVRSLSVVLALLLVLSTCVVMFTASMFTASAAIDYWFVSGNFNNWTQEANSTNKINGSSGSVTIQMNASSIKFKMVASEGGNKWCGNSDGTLTVGTRKELSWNGGKDITCALPANTVAVTFKLDVENGKNYITVTATTSGGGGGGSSSATYVTTVNPDNPNNKTSNGKDIFWVDATYFDYMSDKELSNGWLYPDHVGTSNFNGNIDEWYPFYKFNREIVKSVADSNSGWAKPLYFGNFCNTYNAYDTSHHPGVTNGYNDATSNYNVTRFDYAANNSNGVYDRNTSVQGLMGNTLQYSQLQTPNGTLAPYFNESALGNKANIVKSSFPFRTTDYGTYKRYEFDSTNAKDNVFFTWETANGKTYPKYVNYGAGTTYGVKDGIKEFMNTSSGYGIFPFNNASNNYKGTKTYSNEQLDYGFGIRMDMKFRVPTDTEVKFDFSGDDDLWMYITDETTKQSQLVLDMGGSHKESEGEVNFTTKKATVKKVDNRSASNKDIWIHDYSNWGKVWIYAWGGTGGAGWYEGDASSNLYRFRDDLVGTNGVELGKKTNFLFASNTNFANQTSDLNISDYQGKNTYTNRIDYRDNTDTVGGHSKSVTTNFDFNPDHTYTMTIFYMERGLIESNCKMGFTITPLGNNYVVTERINTTAINPGLQQKVTELSEFGFYPYNNNTRLSESTGYSQFTLSNGGYQEIPKSALPINSVVKVQQYATKNSYLTYDAKWDYYDKENGMIEFANGGHGQGITSKNTDQTTTTANQTLINSVSQDPYDYAELQVDYENTPQSSDVTVTKTTTDGSDKEFGATVYLALDYDSQGQPVYTTYDLEYTDNKSTGTHTATGGRITLQNGKTITFKGIPNGARMYVVEDEDDDYNASYSHSAGSPAIVGTNNALTVTNTPKTITPGEQTITITKQLGQLGFTGDGTPVTTDAHDYTGSLFRFKLEGLEPMDILNADNIKIGTTKDTISTDELITSITNGTASFNKLTFTEEGVYRYHVYEDLSTLSNWDAANGTTYTSDIGQDTAYGPEYLVEITVTKQGTQYIASDPVYIPYTPSATAGITPEDFIISGDGADVASFVNRVAQGSVSIIKSDQNNSRVGETAFSLYAISGSVFDDFDKLSNADKYDLVTNDGQNITSITPAKVAELLDGIGQPYAEQTTTDDGNASFNNLPIYEGDYWKSSAPAYQHYYLIESSPANGYNPNISAVDSANNAMVFTIPIRNAQTQELVYDLEFSIIDGKMINPYTGFDSPLNVIRNIGIGLMILALALGAVYLLRRKKVLVRYKKKH